MNTYHYIKLGKTNNENGTFHVEQESYELFFQVELRTASGAAGLLRRCRTQSRRSSVSKVASNAAMKLLMWKDMPIMRFISA